MNQETKAAYIKFLELHLAELKEDNKPLTLMYKQPNGEYLPTVTTSGWLPDENRAKKQQAIDEIMLQAIRIPIENIAPADLNLPNDEETFWEKAQREGLEEMKNFSDENIFLQEETRMTPIQCAKDTAKSPMICGCIRCTRELLGLDSEGVPKETPSDKVEREYWFPDTIPDSEFILPKENVKKIVKKKK